MKLNIYLKRVGVTTGSLAKNTSHSGLLDLRRQLLGLPEPPKYTGYNNFGSALHEQFLEGKKTFEVTPEEQRLIDEMIKALNKHPLVKRFMLTSIKEEKLYIEIAGVLVAYILDIHCKAERIGADLKSTACRTLEDFVRKAEEYGYFNQAATYIKAANLKMFFFIGITKELRPKIFILSVTDHKDKLTYAQEELDFLLYFYSLYGKLNESGN